MEITNSRLLHNGGSANEHIGCVGFVYGSGKLDKVIMDDCSSSGNGGAATIYTPLKVEFTNTVIQKSQAAVGGAFWIMESPDVALQHVEIDGCKATVSDGGGLAILGGATVALTEVTVRDSRARESGGCLYAAGSDSTLHHVVLDGCTAKDGGGLFVGASANAVASHLTISDCRALGGLGGGLAVSGGVVASHLTISDCHALDGSGGGLAVSGGVVNLHNGSISSMAAEMRSDETLKGGLIDVAGGVGHT